MSEIEEMEQRIAAAMERIANGIGALGSDDAGQVEALQRELEEEKLANAQLTERVRKLSEQAGAPDAKVLEQITALDLEMQRLKKANEHLRESNAALREANAAGVGEAGLINSGMMAELEGLRASRAADVAEADIILGAMESLLVEGEGHA